MTTIENGLEDFKVAMIDEFMKHDNRYNDFDLTGEFEHMKETDPEHLRTELTYHYAKWIYSSVVHDHRPEAETLINLANVIWMLWMQMQEKMPPQPSDEEEC